MRITPTIPQHEFISCPDKFPAFVGGYGSGKTEGLVTRSIIQKLQFPTCNRAFYEPTYDLIRMIAWPRFEEKLTEMNIPYRLIKSPQNLIEIEGHGSIIFRSMDTPHRIIGYEVADSDVDELDVLKVDDANECWTRIIARNRQKKPNGEPNTVAVATTPEGFKFVHRKWVKESLPGYTLIKAPTTSNPHLPSDYVDQLRANYPPHLIEAYLMGEFVNLSSGTVYHCFDRELNHTDRELKKGEALHIGMDFNVGHMAAITHVKDKDNVYAVDEFIDGYDTPDICRQIVERYWRYQDGDYKKTCEIYVYPDASGGSRKSIDAQKSDIKILREFGFQVRAPKKNPPIKDRVNAMNAVLCNSEGHRKYLINTVKCATYADCLEQQAWNDRGEPDKDSGLDHPVDAGGYFIHYDQPIIKPARSIKMGFAQ